MRFFPLLLLLSFCGFVFPSKSHAQHAAVKKAKVKKTAKKNVSATKAAPPATTGPVLTFERTPCYGTCPAYSVQVFADGRVAYEGRRAVPLMGKHELKLPAATVAEMLRQANAAHFESFEKEYVNGATDLPSTVVAVQQPDGSLKKVRAEPNAPDNVQQYFDYLAAQFDRLARLNGLEK